MLIMQNWDISGTWIILQMLLHNLYFHNMRYQTDPMTQTRERWLRSWKISISDLFWKNSKSRVTWPHNGVKKFFCIFQLKSKKIEKNRKKSKKIFFWKKVDFWKKNRSRARILGLKRPLKARDIFFRPWCQYKSCRYWSSLSIYGKWAKSNEANSRNWTKTSFWARFGPVWPNLGPGHFFFENPSSSLF